MRTLNLKDIKSVKTRQEASFYEKQLTKSFHLKYIGVSTVLLRLPKYISIRTEPASAGQLHVTVLLTDGET